MASASQRHDIAVPDLWNALNGLWAFHYLKDAVIVWIRSPKHKSSKFNFRRRELYRLPDDQELACRCWG